MTIIFNKVTPVTPGVEMSGVDFGYRGAPVFRGLTLTIAAQTATALVGANGSGKSTLLSLLAGVARPDRGRVRVGTDNVAFAVQRSQVSDSFPMTAAEAVMMGCWRRLGLFRSPTRRDRAVVDHWLTELQLDDLRDRTLGQLSGGQRQRVLLAQAFAQEAPLLLLDEPTTGLDVTTAGTVISQLARLAEAGITVVAATHDERVIAAARHRIDLDAMGTTLG